MCTTVLSGSTRFIVFDHEGTVVGMAQKEHEQIMPRPGWVEHDPMTIIQNATVRRPCLC